MSPMGVSRPDSQVSAADIQTHLEIQLERGIMAQFTWFQGRYVFRCSVRPDAIGIYVLTARRRGTFTKPLTSDGLDRWEPVGAYESTDAVLQAAQDMAEGAYL